jgi:N-acetylmuramoyl-L-alanine amidase
MYSSTGNSLVAAAGAAALIISGCAPAMVATRGTLPPVPAHDGALAIDVVYPDGGCALVTVRDSTFIFGSVGTGAARLSDQRRGRRGRAERRVPGVPAGAGRWRLQRAGHGRRPDGDGRRGACGCPRCPRRRSRWAGVRIIEGSITPSGIMTGVVGEPVQVRVRGTPGATATLTLPDGRRIPLVEQPAVDRETAFMVDRALAREGISQYVASFPHDDEHHAAATPSPRAWRCGRAMSRRSRSGAGRPQRTSNWYATGRARAHRCRRPSASSSPPPRASASRRRRGPTARVIGRKLPGPGNPFQWFFPNGTRFEVDGESGDFLRLRLAPDFHVWVEAAGVELLPPGTPAAPRRGRDDQRRAGR